MNRTWMALVAVVSLAAAAGPANADPSGYAPPGGPQAGYAGPTMGASEPNTDTLVGWMKQKPDHAPDRYGLLPGLKKMFTKKKTCDTCEGKGSHGQGGAGPYVPPPVNQGTLVFPHNPYVRGPRDFFMYEPAR